ncbi:tetratricopeptide repeat protein [Aestuariivivens insulae]|uniref:tetratricopeptide repeat protein n=1 Tax=Aestuariivivens insulae TaxID=1621988 RepID=UPI001F55E434|nr:tetratricopeptide repeat protein [Aestuariivivens insulae]
MKSIYSLIACMALLLSSCDKEPKLITNQADYNKYLEVVENEMLQLAYEDLEFWEKKLEKDSNQFPYLVKAAASQTLIFNETGNIEALIDAEKKLIEANTRTGFATAAYLRALARNYIAQHRFKEALELLNTAEGNGEKLLATQKMCFDVHLELGNTKEAKAYLDKIENYKDFDFLIRLSKWSDHEGDLDHAILYLKKALEIAEASNYKSLMQWSYTNLADYYGHDGQIQNAYNHYLKALELNPNDAYAKKGIAWIVYSHERNPKEALRILNAVSQSHNSPDYHLLKAEIAEYMGDLNAKEQYLKAYTNAVKRKDYGVMYNKYNALVYAEDYNVPQEAAKIALEEIKNRPTPQSYDLLAWAYYNHGNKSEALNIMETHVVGKTFEPDVLFHLAKIYKDNGKLTEAKALKRELLESTFELGPLMAKKIKNI